jgi:hypothetical protein
MLVNWILPPTLDEGAGGAVHHDVGNVVAAKKRFEGPVAENIIADIVNQIFLFAVDTATFLIATISWTMSRISSRAFSASRRDNCDSQFLNAARRSTSANDAFRNMVLWPVLPAHVARVDGGAQAQILCRDQHAVGRWRDWSHRFLRRV